MKKVLMLFVGLTLSFFVRAQGVEYMSLYEIDPTVHSGHKHPALLPSASYDSQNLYVWSPYTIDLLQVIIRDEDGDIIYNNVCMPLIQGMTTFALSSTVYTDKYSIELIYGDHHLIGYF